MAVSTVTIPVGPITLDCLSPCCLDWSCRCGSNYRQGCALPAPPALFGRPMPAVLYGQVTGYDTLRWCKADPFGPYLTQGVCMAYLTQLTNWPFVRTVLLSGAVVYKPYFNRWDPSTCELLELSPDPFPVGTPGTTNIGAYLEVGCVDELRCTWAKAGNYGIWSCKSGGTGCNSPNPFTQSRVYPSFFLDTPRVDTSMGWVRSGVLSCDPFWGRIEFFDAVVGGPENIPSIPPLGDLGGDTCDQSGHPSPPCCPDGSGRLGPCGLLSLPPFVASREADGDTCSTATFRAPLAVAIDFTEDPI
jgi:hypothetical protein